MIWKPHRWWRRLWPLTWRSALRKLEVENYDLRCVLQNTQRELQKHRILLADLRNANKETEDQLQRIWREAKSV